MTQALRTRRWVLGGLTAGLAGFGAGGARAAASTVGKFLVAKPAMPDPRFAETVLVMCKHSAEGAFGLIINRPLGEVPTVELAGRLGLRGPAAAETPPRIVVHYGGPVDPEVGFVLHTPDWSEPGTARLTPEISFSSTRELLAALLAGKGPRRFLLTIGYAGWAPGQLDGEMEQGGWETAAARGEIVFEGAAAEKWQAVRRRGVDL